MSIRSPLASGKRGARIIRGLTTVRLCLVRKKAGEGLSEVADGLGLRLVLAVTSGARDPAEERGVAEGVEGIGQGLGLIQQRMGLLLRCLLIFHRGLGLIGCGCFIRDSLRVWGRRSRLGLRLNLSWRLDIGWGLAGFGWGLNLCWGRG